MALCVAYCCALVMGLSGAPSVANARSAARSAARPVAILSVFSGSVLMRAAGGDFASISDGAALYIGNTLRTSEDARAILTLFEGAMLELEPASDTTIEDATGGASAFEQLAQSFGRTWQVVTHLTTADSRYEDRMSSATASVRGGEFEVAASDGPTGSLPALSMTEHGLTISSVAAPSAVVVASDQAAASRASVAASQPKRPDSNAARAPRASGTKQRIVFVRVSATTVSPWVASSADRDDEHDDEGRDGEDDD